MKIKQIHFGLSILSFILGLIFFIVELSATPTVELSLLFFALMIVGGYGIAKYIYDK